MGSNETPTNIELQDDVTAALQDANAVDSILGVSCRLTRGWSRCPAR
jgi:hypothetical protein